jgi:integrase
MIQKRGARWRVVVQAGRDPLTGVRRQLSGSADTERDAIRLERQLRLQAEEGIVGNIKLSDLVAEWWASKPRLAPTTRANYRGNLDKHILPLLGDKPVREIRPRLVAAFLRRLQEETGMRAATARKVRSVLSAVLSYGVAMEYVESNAAMKVPPPELDATERVAPTLEETARILFEAERSDPEFLAFLWVAAETGGRRGETLALRWQGVDFERGTVTIDGTVSIGDDGAQVRSSTKTKKPRTIAVSSITLDHLRDYKRRIEELREAAAGEPYPVDLREFVFSGGGQADRRDLIDSRPWRPDATTRRFRLLKERAGVRPEIDLHGLRHTMITEMLAAGVDPRTVMGRAGHSSESTTLTVYAKVRPAIDAAAAEMWGQVLSDKLRELRESADETGAAQDRVDV